MPERLNCTCAIAGGGPAGVMLGYLLARAGVRTLVLEKHADFLRDFRGDTVHPATLELMHELGLLEDFLARPHQEMRQVSVNVGGYSIAFADFSHLPTHCRFIAFMPQWDFLDFLAGRAERFPAFQLRREAEVFDLIERSGRVAGLRAHTRDGELQVRAKLVIAADGRQSTVRARSGLQVDAKQAPIDVLWLRLPRAAGDPPQGLGYLDRGRMMVLLDRGDFWQCGYLIPKGGFEAIRNNGLEQFRNGIAELAPFLHDRVGNLTEWDQVKLLAVQVDRLRCWWRPGLLCIGDAAHAMSPVGGVGINLAIQDAVAAANVLAMPLRNGALDDALLAAVQRRRELPTRMVQSAQVLIHNRVISKVLGQAGHIEPPLLLQLFNELPLLRRVPAHLIGLGFWREHVRSPERALQR